MSWHSLLIQPPVAINSSADLYFMLWGKNAGVRIPTYLKQMFVACHTIIVLYILSRYLLLLLNVYYIIMYKYYIPLLLPRTDPLAHP